jgi:hypothetical protein
VYLPAINGHVPEDIVRTLRAFLEFCYIARQDIQDTQSLEVLQNALTRFHHYWNIFLDCGIHSDFNLPWQYVMVHYFQLIQAFGAPNGLCSSITESKHIKAIKKPWHRSNHFNTISQMLLTNQQLDKLAASHVNFTSHGMLKGTCLTDILANFGRF